MLPHLRRAYTHVVLLHLVVIAAAVTAGRDWMGVVFLAMLAFAVLNPLVVAFGTSWWAETILSGVGFGAVLPLCQVLDSLGLARLREDAMAVLGSILLYLLAVPVSGAIRYVRHRRLRAADRHASAQAPDVEP